MSATFAQLKASLLTRLRADSSSPSLDNLADESIAQWANDSVPRVVRLLAESDQLQVHKRHDVAINLTGGIGSLFSDFEYALAVKTGDGKRYTELMRDHDDFAKMDGQNFMTAPTTDYPVAIVTTGKIKVKPTTITKAFLDYIEQPDAITTSGAATIWGDLADEVLLELIAAKFFDFRKLPERAAVAEKRAERLAA